MATKRAAGNVIGSSQVAGTNRPIHVMVIGEDGTQVFPQSAAATWTRIHRPAANTQATIAKAAAGAGVRNVCTALTVVLAATAAAPTAVNLNVSVIDGASGGTTYLWGMTISIPAVAGATTGAQLTNLWLPGSANTALTIEFSAAGGANTIESVWMSGTTVTAA